MLRSRNERIKKFMEVTRVDPSKKVKLDTFETGWAQNEEAKYLGKAELKERSHKLLEVNREELGKAQELLYANHTYAVLIILQGRDAAGKDGTIKHVMSGINPQGCNVTSFKQPSTTELSHDFLWRETAALPEKGMIEIFNRSHYEEVLVTKVHSDLLDKQNLPCKKYNKEFWDDRYQDIVNFEKHLVRNGTIVLKFFLHISKDEQKQRFQERLINPDKYWKFSDADLKERDYWDQYTKSYEDMLNNTTSKHAPWYIIPADYKWFARALVADIITTSILALKIDYPTVDDQKLAKIAEAKQKLENEKS
jgi:PPK2 family polyphosphate:nucleotide phosphotransferase